LNGRIENEEMHMKRSLKNLLAVGVMGAVMGTASAQVHTAEPEQRSPATTAPWGRNQKVNDDLKELTGLELNTAATTVQPVIEARIDDLAREKEHVLVILAGLREKEKVIQSRISQVTREAKEQIEKDATLAQLQELAASKEKQVARMKELQANKLISAEEMERGINEAAEARVRVQERKETIQALAGGGALGMLTKELLVVGLSINEQEPMLKHINERSSKFREVLRAFMLIAYPDSNGVKPTPFTPRGRT
jgi:hypothetical protein